MYILGTAYFVTPLLGAGIHAGIEVCVVEDDGVCIKHSPNCRAAAVGQDAAEHLPVPVKPFDVLLHIEHIGLCKFLSIFDVLIYPTLAISDEV